MQTPEPISITDLLRPENLGKKLARLAERLVGLEPELRQSVDKVMERDYASEDEMDDAFRTCPRPAREAIISLVFGTALWHDTGLAAREQIIEVLGQAKLDTRYIDWLLRNMAHVATPVKDAKQVNPLTDKTFKELFDACIRDRRVDPDVLNRDDFVKSIAQSNELSPDVVETFLRFGNEFADAYISYNAGRRALKGLLEAVCLSGSKIEIFLDSLERNQEEFRSEYLLSLLEKVHSRVRRIESRLKDAEGRTSDKAGEV